MEYRLNKKLPAWIGSILFHAVLLLLIALWFSLSPGPKLAPGVERNAIGSILMQSQGDVHGQSAGVQSADSDVAAENPENFSTVSLDVLLTTPALAPGRDTATPAGTESATDIAGAFGDGNSGGSGMGDGAATVSFFGEQGKGTKFMYVLDHSESMEGVPLRMAKEELIRSFESLDKFHQFNIVFYNGWHQLWRPGKKLPFATAEEKEDAKQYVQRVQAIGGTKHFDPIKEAIEHRPDVIFLLTDGESYDDYTLRLSELTRLNSRRGYDAQIIVIQFGSESLTSSPSRSLQQLAEQNHGQYRYVLVPR